MKNWSWDEDFNGFTGLNWSWFVEDLWSAPVFIRRLKVVDVSSSECDLGSGAVTPVAREVLMREPVL
jgi:hypothetical protein